MELPQISQILPEPPIMHSFTGYMNQQQGEGSEFIQSSSNFDRRKRPAAVPPEPSECPFKLPKPGQAYAPNFNVALMEVNQELNYLRSNLINLPHCTRLLEQEYNRLGDKINPEWIDWSVPNMFSTIKLSQKIFLPEPRGGINIVGRIIGRKGSTLQQIISKYHCRIQVYGRGSKGGSDSESALLNSGHPRYAHFSMPLHAVVTIESSPREAYNRMGNVLDLLNKIINMRETFEHDGIRIELHAQKRTDQIYENRNLSLPTFSTMSTEENVMNESDQKVDQIQKEENQEDHKKDCENNLIIVNISSSPEASKEINCDTSNVNDS